MCTIPHNKICYYKRSGNVEFKDVCIKGRKIDIRVALLKKQERYMRLFTNEEIESMSREEKLLLS